MERLFKLGLVACGFFLATLASSAHLTAAQSFSKTAGSCVGSGNCGTTSEGTELYGKWTEGSGAAPIGL